MYNNPRRSSAPHQSLFSGAGRVAQKLLHSIVSSFVQRSSVAPAFASNLRLRATVGRPGYGRQDIHISGILDLFVIKRSSVAQR